MSTETYEDKRKCQNREAQRRYRQKMRRKKRGGAAGGVDATDIPWPGMNMFDDAQMVIGMEQQTCFAAMQEGGYSMTSYSPDGGDASNLDAVTLQPSPGTDFSSSSTSTAINLADVPWSCAPSLRLEGPSPSVDQGSTTLMQASSATGPAGSRPASGAAPDRTSSAQAKLVSKACGMVQELRRLYHLGVELDLLRHESEIPAHLDAVEQLMHSSGRRCPR
ncbi:hypothetical protein ISF_07795 [Cordyceps fumosorosea ARSEF 2679]|uniref:BZIP domain-containing protein n=1 Tax=Cordyceps fumosorosea (strain ARSEF 2679) TaxID=1081104 RepID=A0A162MG89_CORFA|nr:hypothetical protein ISF_07795 [Cordyceps fumosorosea ARSEF 2679]OAA55690.1 hypothetical protein ISF_07795 [Cordyceps fumosorosea ARSEF 2679]